MNISKMNKLEVFIWLVVILSLGNWFVTYEAEQKIMREASNKISTAAEQVRSTQIANSNKVAKVLIANATSEQKACLNLPGIIKLFDQPYKRAEACHLGELPKVEGLWHIKQRLK